MKFRLVDQIVEWHSGREIRGYKAVSFEEYCLKEPFGDEPQLPASLFLQSIFELGNWLIMLSSSFAEMGCAVELEHAKFTGALKPGEKAELIATALGPSPAGLRFRGEAWVADRQVLAVSSWLMRIDVLSRYCDASDLRVLFSEIHRPPTAEA